jgi:pimeloyl-ACP methyl ester carboxylesterase
VRGTDENYRASAVVFIRVGERTRISRQEGMLKAGLGVTAAVVAAAAVSIAWVQLPAIGAGALLHPWRKPVTDATPAGCAGRDFKAEGVTLRGWTCEPDVPAVATIVYLHGIADNRQSATGVIARYRPRGYRVVAYDSRANGASDGEACTYGFYEKLDLHRVIDALPDGPVVLIGTSLGAAVALQEAPDDPRVAAVVAAETFSDLRTVATERAPFVFTKNTIARAFALAGSQARFSVDDVSPARDARRLTVPVLLIHGAADVDTPPGHSERVRAALAGPSRLILVPGAGHNHSLNGEEVWREIDRWLARVNDAAPQRPTPK